MSQTDTFNGVPRWKRRVASGLLVLTALGAVLSFAAAAASIQSTRADAAVAATWQMFGFLVFAGLFVLLAYRPHQYPGVWELVIFHKAATALYLAIFASDAAGATVTVAVDAHSRSPSSSPTCS
ncbi:hypothetical protein [Natronorubrum halophilum]|uniref:hypothetical protein n=1 Tax=Natronorubrum halophilum TaxID=1702106 RepID=UPI001EE85942|nr:hypothetical protein [Natronorubrum halophilum]